MGAWMLYAILTSALCVAAATLLEPVFAARRIPVRLLWLASLVAALALASWAAVRPDGRSASSALAIAPLEPAAARHLLAPAVPGPGRASISVRTTGDTSGVALDLVLAGLWAGSAAVCLTVLLLSALRLRRRRRLWREDVVAGVPVLVSHDVGPAVIGLVRRRIVVPAWIRSLDAEAQGLVLRHEVEHVRAGDPQLLWSAAVLVRLMPWNLPLWFALQRLRHAIEVDCDARVLRDRPDARRYCALLLDVGERTIAGVAPLPALAEPATGLERRILAMTARRSLTRRSLAGAGMAAVLLALACQSPRPQAGPTARLSLLAASGPWRPALPPAAPDTSNRVAIPAPFDTLPTRLRERRVRIDAIADSVIRTSYPEATHLPDGTPAFLALVLDGRDRVIRHAMSYDPALPHDVGAAMLAMHVDTVSARTMELGIARHSRWHITLGYTVEGPGPVHGRAEMHAWHQSEGPPPNPEGRPTRLQWIADSLAHARTPEAFRPHAGLYAVAVLFDRNEKVIQYAARRVPDWWIERSRPSGPDGPPTTDMTWKLGQLTGRPGLKLRLSGADTRMVAPIRMVAWGVTL
jgi:beta-lactamase regulating signal transducer with metallopeptidase domain